MGRPRKLASELSKTSSVRNTKGEVEKRIAAEKEIFTGIEVKESAEVKNNVAAHKEFLRISQLLKAAGRNDGVFENIINNYALLKAEIKYLIEERDNVDNTKDYIKLDQRVDVKRKLLLELEKQLLITPCAAINASAKKAAVVNNDDGNDDLFDGDDNLETKLYAELLKPVKENN